MLCYTAAIPLLCSQLYRGKIISGGSIIGSPLVEVAIKRESIIDGADINVAVRPSEFSGDAISVDANGYLKHRHDQGIHSELLGSPELIKSRFSQDSRISFPSCFYLVPMGEVCVVAGNRLTRIRFRAWDFKNSIDGGISYKSLGISQSLIKEIVYGKDWSVQADASVDPSTSIYFPRALITRSRVIIDSPLKSQVELRGVSVHPQKGLPKELFDGDLVVINDGNSNPTIKELLECASRSEIAPCQGSVAQQRSFPKPTFPDRNKRLVLFGNFLNDYYGRVNENFLETLTHPLKQLPMPHLVLLGQQNADGKTLSFENGWAGPEKGDLPAGEVVNRSLWSRIVLASVEAGKTADLSDPEIFSAEINRVAQKGRTGAALFTPLRPDELASGIAFGQYFPFYFRRVPADDGGYPYGGIEAKLSFAWSRSSAGNEIWVTSAAFEKIEKPNMFARTAGSFYISGVNK
jgi:hypothetical protein